MKKMLRLLAILLSSGIAGLAGESRVNSDIEKAVDEFVINWNKHDPGAMSDSWLSDGDLISPHGRRARGHEQIAQLFTDEQTGSGPFRNSTMKMDVSNVREICTGYAIVDTEATVTGAEFPPHAPQVMQFHVALVMEEQEGVWKFVSVRPYTFASGPPPE